MNREELKKKILETNWFADDIWLEKYLDLIVSNKDTVKIKYLTQSHHIIPRFYYNKNKLKVLNEGNLVNLIYGNHILAHYYLSKCSLNDEAFKGNVLAIDFCLKNKNIELSEEEIISKIPDYNEMYKLAMKILSKKASGRVGPKNSFYGRHHTEDTRKQISMSKTNPTPEIRKHLSDAAKKVDHSLNVKLMAEYNRNFRDYSEQGKKISKTKKENGSGNNRKGKIKIIKENSIKYILPKDLEYFYNLGYEIHHNWLKNKIKTNDKILLEMEDLLCLKV